MDFGKLDEQREKAKELRLERFGSENPAITDSCKRCGAEYGKHREVGRIYCLDEFRAEFPHIPVQD